jgi:DNA repair exonuclease SbcCD nuclease subunit
MKFIHASDLHLRTVDAAEQLETLGAIVALARERDADFILMAGDLFDSDHDANLLRPQVRHILEDWSRPAVLLPGNHDARSYGPTADYGPKAVLAQEDVTLFDHLGELPLVCLPYQPHQGFADRREALARLNRPAVVACHGTLFLHQWLGWLREEKEDVGDYFPIYPEDLKGLAIRYLAMGHFHRRFYHSTQPVLCCYPGSAYPVTVRETGPRSVALVHLEGESSGQVEAIALEGTTWYQSIELRCLPRQEERMFAELEEALSSLPPEARPVVSVSGYAHNERGIRERLEKRLRPLRGPKPRVELFDYGDLLENTFYRLFVENLQEESGSRSATSAAESDRVSDAVRQKALEIVTLGFSRLQKG